MKIAEVEFDKSQPELMDKIEEHWRARAFCKRQQTLDCIIREWRAGHTRLLMYEEVIECLKENLSQSN